ncbi:cytochrome P450 [Pengzhenrongella sp.]|jgi:cytochrome P450|uniref:cytochrome P450 n=1 Tax=Pengzhenrongella sp. TaxID=2888820 RepID=UPI002F9536D1
MSRTAGATGTPGATRTSGESGTASPNPSIAAGTYRVLRDPATVREVLHRPDDFSPANALTAVTPLSSASLRVLRAAGFALPPVLASNATPAHAGIRRVVAGFFTPATVAGIEPRIRALARAATGAAAGELRTNGTVDLVRAVAGEPPAMMMLEMLGLPARDVPQLKAWSRDSLELFWGWPDEDRQLHLARSAGDFYRWLRDLVRAAVAAPERNLFRSLAEHGLSTPELCSMGYFLLIAGQETTSQLIGTTLYRLLDGTSASSWHEAATSTGATAAVRGVLAGESSVPTWRRVTANPTWLDGELLPAGAEILLELTGNHDDDARPTAYSLAFGSGIHRCLGAKLAELEAAVVVQETAAALPAVALSGAAPAWTRLLSFQSPRAVLVSPR